MLVYPLQQCCVRLFVALFFLHFGDADPHLDWSSQSAHGVASSDLLCDMIRGYRRHCLFIPNTSFHAEVCAVLEKLLSGNVQTLLRGKHR